ncbi:MAG TPA: DUF1822 family protein [Leptolyngbyaceae cyanobacterium M33_DOE_097]|uniref:DUF1822 family protein n=1 Tax=Oscillatoriales cyanobacterium SpSt-418 TaxID=2282169 RepID=A0A7C3KHG5_9CYAN|nr:DUF1822 family protein [Leptolyngbyaceae cyanobacterium M33_DOE_097]
MQDLRQTMVVSVPLSATNHRIAEKISRQVGNSVRTKQIYLNTLAISAVQFYFECMGLETNREKAQDPIVQALMNRATLHLTGLGDIECCPVLPDSKEIEVAPEAWEDHLAYVAVQFEASLRQATILGFSRSAKQGSILLSDLEPIDALIPHLQDQAVKQPMQLVQWLQGTFDASWKALEEFIQPDLLSTLAYRSSTHGNEMTVKRAKLFDLAMQIDQCSIILLVAITPETEQKTMISVQVHPMRPLLYLPPNLDLELLLDSRESLQAVRSRNQDNYIQLKRFYGTTGEKFEIRLTLGDASLTETFII